MNLLKDRLFIRLLILCIIGVMFERAVESNDRLVVKQGPQQQVITKEANPGVFRVAGMVALAASVGFGAFAIWRARTVLMKKEPTESAPTKVPSFVLGWVAIVAVVMIVLLLTG